MVTILREQAKESSIVGRRDVCSSTKEKELASMLTSVHSPTILKSPFMFPKERVKANGALGHLVAQLRLQDAMLLEEVVRPPLEELAREDPSSRRSIRLL